MSNNDKAHITSDSSKNYYILNYSHTKIEQLLEKIDKGWVLSEEEYRTLAIVKGIDNLSTFSGSYNDLTDKPDLNGLSEELSIKIDNISNNLYTAVNNFENVLDDFNDNLETKASIDDMNNALALKSDVGHTHNDLQESININKESIENILNRINSSEEGDGLITESNLDTILENYIDNEEFDAAIDGINADVEELLEEAVKKEEGKGLSTNDLTNELHALLLEILNDANNTDKTVNEFVLDRIDNALLNPDSELAKALAGKVDAEEGKGLSDNNFTDEQMALLEEILNGSDVDGDGAVSVLDFINKAIDDDIANIDEAGALGNLLANKVDKEEGKGLSSNDFTDAQEDLLNQVLGASTNTEMANFVNDLIIASINNTNENDGVISIGEILANKVDKSTFVTLEKDASGSIEVVADDEANFDETTMIKLSDALLINPDLVVGDKLIEVEKDMGLSEVPFTEEQSNFLNQVMAQGATNEDAVKDIITDSINAVDENGAPIPGSINEALTQRDELINGINEDFELFQDAVVEDLAEKVNNSDFDAYKEEVNNALDLKLNISDFEIYQQEVINNYATKEEVNTALNNKVDKVDGMGLSSNDYTDEDKAKLDSIALVTEAEIDAAFVAAGFDI